MSVEIKVYLTNIQMDENLCFHTVVYNDDDYDLFFDLNETYESIMTAFLKDTFKFNYFNENSLDKETMIIPKVNNYENVIKEFITFLQDIYGLTVVSNIFALHSHFGIRLVGAGYRGNGNSPMLEHSQFSAMNSMHAIKTALFSSANNTDYESDDIYIKKAHGSLILTLESVKRYTDPITFIQEIYNDIENKTINPFKYPNGEKRTKYQSIIKGLSELNNQKRLKDFYVIIDGIEHLITERNYLRNQSKKIYNEAVNLRGVFQGYKKGSNSFELFVVNEGKFFCHLNKLEKTNYTKFEEIIIKLRRINIFDTNIFISIEGQKVKSKTINITDIV